jgi:hypothetical protein
MIAKDKGKEVDKKECYDCWRRRFRRDMTEKAQASNSEIAKVFDTDIRERESVLESLREKFTTLRDEILELRLLAGDHFMNRYEEHEEKGR